MNIARALCLCLAIGSVASVVADDRVREYGVDPKVIDVGYGVLATPMSVIGEIMRRDRILSSAGRRAGFEFRFHAFEKGVDTLQPMRDNKLDASMPTDVVVLDLISREDYVLAGYVRQSFSSVIGPKVLTMADLKGKRVGNARGTSGHNTLLQGLDGAGLSESDVTLVQMNVREMPDALLDGRIDAFAAWEPTPSTFLKKHAARYRALHRQISPAYFTISRRMVETQPEAALHLVAALHRAIHWMNFSRTNLALAAHWTRLAMKAFTGREPELSEKDIANLTRSDLLDIPGVPRIPHGETQTGGNLWRSFDFYKSRGKLPAGMTWQRVQSSFDRALTSQVITQNRPFRLHEFEYGNP